MIDVKLRPELVAEVRRTRWLTAVAMLICPTVTPIAFPLWAVAHQRIRGRPRPDWASWMPLAPLTFPIWVVQERSLPGCLLLVGASVSLFATMFVTVVFSVLSR